jgi:hydroxymethylglutaryl-CoA lyase
MRFPCQKLRLIAALAETGLRHIQVCSFVSPRLVPGWADADAVVAGLRPRADVAYSALWFNAKGLSRALTARDILTLSGSISLSASNAFTRKNLHRSHEQNLAAMREMTREHLAAGIDVKRIGVMAAFGCNYQGDISPAQVIQTLQDGFAIADEFGVTISDLSLADTMGRAAPGGACSG